MYIKVYRNVLDLGFRLKGLGFWTCGFSKLDSLKSQN